jgi:glycosyltransferase involved in cell wall biosynthesis
MKYLVAVDHCFLDAPGGMGRVAWDIAMVMRDRRHDVAMVVARPQPGTDAPSVTECHGVRVLRYSRPPLPGWHPLRGYRVVDAARSATRQLLGSERWDVVHMHSPLTGAGVLGALGHGPRYVYTLHSPVVMEQEINWARQGRLGQVKMLLGLGALKRLERRVLRPCARIHTLSEYSRSKVEHFHGLGQRVRVVPYWRRPELRRRHTKVEARRRLGWPLEGPTIFSVRHLGPRYGLDVAIEALAPLARERRCIFFIAGVGPLRAELMDLAQRRGVSEQIRFLGRMEEPELELAYQAADLFLLPTRALECFGLVILEACAFGCPVLSTDAGAIPELMHRLLPEFVVPAGNVTALRDKLEHFLAGRLRAPAPEALFAQVERTFGKQVITPDVVALLEGEPA